MTVRPLAEVEKEEILRAIIEKGSVVDAAKALKIGRATIYAKLQRYGIAVKANQILRELRRQRELPIIPESGRTSS